MGNMIAVLTTAFNEEKLIGPCVRQFKRNYLGYNIYHMILVSEKPWRGNWDSRAEEVADIAWNEGAEFIKTGKWETQAQQLNYGLAILQKNFDWVFIVDSDEYYESIDIHRLALETLNPGIDSIYVPKMNVYWKTSQFVISPPQTDTPIVAVKTNRRFHDKRNLIAENKFMSDVTLHHFSYVRDDQDMLKKIESFEHSNEFDREYWYNNKWLQWHEDMEDLHPVVPEQFKKAVHMPAPKEIEENFYADEIAFNCL